MEEIIEFFSERRSKRECEQFSLAILKSGNIDMLIQCFKTAPSPIPERISWVITMISDKSPESLNTHCDFFIQYLQTSRHQSIERSLMRSLSDSRISEESSGLLLDTCFKWLLDPQKLVAAKVHAMETAFKLSLPYPELLDELEEIIKSEYDKHTVAFQSRGRKILKKINTKKKSF